MNARFILLLPVCTAALALRGQPTTPPPDAPPGAGAAPTAQMAPANDDDAPAPARTAEQLDQLLGPIALYPDALVAVILPASSVPSDIVLASRFLSANGAPEAIDDQPWDESVKSLAHYPEVVKWMDDNLEWTRELGETFVAQPADVMKAMQRLRAKAQATGALKTTPQQQVVMEGSDISIVPAQPDVIYVPRYDPAVVYVETTSYYPDPFLTFGVGFAVGPWLYYDFDWGQRVIWVGGHGPRGNWHGPALYSRPHYANNPDWRRWHPSPRTRAARPGYYHPRQEVVRPRPYTGASPRATWPRGAQGNPNATGPQGGRPGRDEHSPTRPSGAVAPQGVNGGGPRPAPAPNANGPRNENFQHAAPGGGSRHDGRRAGIPTPTPAPGVTAQQVGPRPVQGPPTRPSVGPGPSHAGAPHVQHAGGSQPHGAPAARPAPAPSPRAAEREQPQK